MKKLILFSTLISGLFSQVVVAQSNPVYQFTVFNKPNPADTLYLKTANGCDSIVFAPSVISKVINDTLRYEVIYTDFTIHCETFADSIIKPRDPDLMLGCDSIFRRIDIEVDWDATQCQMQRKPVYAFMGDQDLINCGYGIAMDSACYLECDTVQVFDTLWKPACGGGYEIDRIDMGYTYTCVKRCPPQISGYVSYDSLWDLSNSNNIELHRPIANVTVYLHDANNGQIIDSTMSTADGGFAFKNRFPTGQYYTTGSSPHKTVSVYTDDYYGSGNDFDYGVSSVDAYLVLNWSLCPDCMPYVAYNGSSPYLTKKTMIYAAANTTNYGDDWNNYNITAMDASLILNRTVNPSFTYAMNYGAQDWEYSTDTFTLSQDISNLHIYGVMVGDPNLSYIPQPYIRPNENPGPLAGNGIDYLQDKEYFAGNVVGDLYAEWLNRRGSQASPYRRDLAKKASSYVPLTQPFGNVDTLYVNGNDPIVSLPVISGSTTDITSVQLFFTIPGDDVEVLDVEMPLGGLLAHHVIGNQVRIAWIPDSARPVAIRKGEVMFNLELKVNNSDRIESMLPQFRIQTGSSGVSDSRLKRDAEFTFALPTIMLDKNSPTARQGYRNEKISNESAEGSTGKASEPAGIAVIPNPIVERGEVIYSVPNNESVVTIKLFNLSGVEVCTVVASERQNAGTFRRSLSVENVPNGIYILRMETVSNGRTTTSGEKVVVNR